MATKDCELEDLDCIIADPCYVATQGICDACIGISTQGFIVEVPFETPVVTPAVPGNVGALIGDPRREWWVRKDENDTWVGPYTYQEANSRARRMTMPRDINRASELDRIKYAQVGTIMGTRGGDPNVSPHMRVAFMYENGKQYLAGRMAEFNKDKVP